MIPTGWRCGHKRPWPRHPVPRAAPRPGGSTAPTGAASATSPASATRRFCSSGFVGSGARCRHVRAGPSEPLPGVAQTRARQTDRLRAVHRTIGLALGGNPGARHAATMGVPISRTTLLQRIRTSDAVPGPAVSVLGVDDWAWRKGQRYGTILVDLERRRVVDL